MFFFILFIAITAAVSPTCTNFTSTVESTFSAILSNYQQKGGILGISVGSGVGTHNKILVADGVSKCTEVVTTSMHYRMGGELIPTLSVLFWLLEEDGLLSVNSTVDTWLPNVPGSSNMTIFHLCYSQSGLKNYQTFPAFTAEYTDRFKAWTTEELLDLVYNSTLAFQPGTNNSNSDTSNTVVAIRIIELATNKTFAEVLEEYILRPLNLKATYQSFDVQIEEPVLSTYSDTRVTTFEDSTYWNPSWGGGITSVISNTEDMLRLTWATYNHFLDSVTFAELTEGVNIGYPGSTSSQYYAAGFLVGGLGVINTTVYWRNMRHGGYMGIAAYLPEYDMSLVLKSNTEVVALGSLGRPMLTDFLAVFTLQELHDGVISC